MAGWGRSALARRGRGLGARGGGRGWGGASGALAACGRRVGKDFAQRYGYAPWLLETFVDGERHAGTCFQAANWQRIGATKGRGRNDREGRRAQSVKAI